MGGANSCGVLYTPPLTWGAIFVILFAVVSVLYVGGGAAYNVKVGVSLLISQAHASSSGSVTAATVPNPIPSPRQSSHQSNVSQQVRGREATLASAFPQWHLWKQLPGLVNDGCAFSWEEAKKAYYAAQGQTAPLDQSLTKRLAAAQEEDAFRGNPVT